MEYPKTENLWARDPETHLMAPENGIRVEEHGLVDNWLVLEKIDGMNMRVIWRPLLGELHIYGRSDKAVIPGDLLDKMRDYFTQAKMYEAFKRAVFETDEETGEKLHTGFDVPDEVILFGEGYGGKIQKGSHYREDKDFMLFDVVIDGRWGRWSSVEWYAEKLGVETVPVVAEHATLAEAQMIVSLMWAGAYSGATDQPEGIIARTDPYLFTQRGSRVVFKHKVRDAAPWLEKMGEELMSLADTPTEDMPVADMTEEAVTIRV